VKLQLYILRQLLVSFTFAAAGMFFIALPGIAVAAVHKLPNTDTLVLLHYIPLVLQSLAPYVLPISFLLAVVATYGRLAADNEWTSIQMAGLRPLLMLTPALALAAVLGSVTYWMVSSELPNIHKREKQYIIDAARRALTNIAPGLTDIQMGDFSLHAAYRDDDPATGAAIFREVLIHKPGGDDGREIKVFADTARLDFSEDVLSIRLTQVRPVDEGFAAEVGFMELEYRLADYLERREKRYSGIRYRTTAMLRDALASTTDEKLANAYQYEIHHRYSMAAAFVMFLGLGASTGLLLRRGTQLGALAVSVGYALVYYIMSMRVGKQLGRSGVLPPEIGAWATIAFGCLAGVILLRKALRR